jgi:hypothetical protein
VPTQTYTVFIEYWIQREKWETFKQAIPHLQTATKEIGTTQRHSFLTGREQPYLVVEVIEVADEQIVKEICHRRKEVSDPSYSLLWPWIDEERANLQIWVFEPIASFYQLVKDKTDPCKST